MPKFLKSLASLALLLLLILPTFIFPSSALAALTSCSVTVEQYNQGNICTTCFEPGLARVTVNSTDELNNPHNGTVYLDFFNDWWTDGFIPSVLGVAEYSYTFNSEYIGDPLTIGVKADGFVSSPHICTVSTPALQAAGTCDLSQCTPTTEPPPSQASPFKLCAQIPDLVQRGKCEACAGGANGYSGVWTAIGCISRDPQVIIARLVIIGLGTGGGVSLLMILAAAFMLSTSEGDPKRTGEAKEMVTAAIVGLIFVIFSITLLRFIGQDILRIPGFGG